MGKWVHRLTEINPEERTALCAECGIVRIRFKNNTNLWVCTVARKKWKKERSGSTPQKRIAKSLAQDGKCAICKKEKPLQWDHCHKTNKPRDMLCQGCNSGLGFFYDDIDSLKEAIKYLRKHAD